MSARCARYRRGCRRVPWTAWFIPLLVATAGCQATARRDDPNPLFALPIDTTRVRTVDQAAAWAYRREAVADLDGNGTQERVVITADASVTPDGTVLWEDGHRWAVYVEAADGRRRLLYGAFVPNGFTECAILQPDDAGRRRVLIQERARDQMRALEVEYLGPDSARSASGAWYPIEQWLPGAGALP